MSVLTWCEPTVFSTVLPYIELFIIMVLLFCVGLQVHLRLKFLFPYWLNLFQFRCCLIVDLFNFLFSVYVKWEIIISEKMGKKSLKTSEGQK
jgi:hypothetical protein